MKLATASAVAVYHRLRTTQSNRYDFTEGELNGLGYALLGKSDVGDAVRIFELNAEQFPGSSNVFDSLGDAYSRANRRKDARKAYSRALALDPANANAHAVLQKLGEDLTDSVGRSS